MVNTTTMAAKQGRQIGYQRWAWSTSLSPSLRYLRVHLQVRVWGLDLVTKRRLWRRCARSWIMGSSTVWGDIWSVWGTEYVQSCQTEVCCRSRSRRRWLKRVSPYSWLCFIQTDFFPFGMLFFWQSWLCLFLFLTWSTGWWMGIVGIMFRFWDVEDSCRKGVSCPRVWDGWVAREAGWEDSGEGGLTGEDGHKDSGEEGGERENKPGKSYSVAWAHATLCLRSSWKSKWVCHGYVGCIPSGKISP